MLPARFGGRQLIQVRRRRDVSPRTLRGFGLRLCPASVSLLSPLRRDRRALEPQLFPPLGDIHLNHLALGGVNLRGQQGRFIVDPGPDRQQRNAISLSECDATAEVIDRT